MAGLRSVLGTAAAVVLLAGCLDDPVAPAPTYEWFAELHAEDAAWEDFIGEGNMLWTEGAALIAARGAIGGDEVGEVRAWNIGHGSCADPGAVLGDAGAYPPLVIGATGIGETITQVGIAAPLEREAPFYLAVFEEAEDGETLLACGDLQIVGAF